MSARDVIEHALRVYYADSRDPKDIAARLLAMYDAERPAVPPLYVADYDSAPLALHLTREAARAACDDIAKTDANGRCWDWRAEEDGVDRQVWTHPDDDRPVGYTGGAVWEVTVERDEAGKGTPAGGELTRARDAAAAYLRDANGDTTLSPMWRVVDSDTERATGIGLVCTATGDADEHVVLDDVGRDELGVYGCCPYPVIETWSTELAQYLVALLNADRDGGRAERDRVCVELEQQTGTEAVPCVRPEPHPAHLHSGLRNGAVVHGRCPGVPADFFQPGRTYQRRRWQFQCLAVAPSPFNGETRAVGFLYRPGESATVTGMAPEHWEHDGWTEVTESGDQR